MEQPESLSFKTATPDLARIIAALVNSAYRGDSSRNGWTTEADFLHGQRIDEAMLVDIMSNKDSRIECMYLNTTDLVGVCHLDRNKKGVCHLGMLTVNPLLQAKGFGKRLMEHAEHVARRDWQCSTMSITVISIRSELVQFYQRRGYQKTGLVENFPYGDSRFGLQQFSDLKFIEMVKTL